MNNLQSFNDNKLKLEDRNDKVDPKILADVLSDFADILTERLQRFSGVSIRCRASGIRETDSSALPPISRSGFTPMVYFGESLEGEFLISLRIFDQIISTISGQQVDRTVQRDWRPLSRIETLVLTDIGEIVAASFARALPKAMSSFDLNGYAPHPEVRFGGFQRRSWDRFVHTRKLLAFDMTLHAGGVTGSFTLLTPSINAIVVDQPIEKYSSLRDQWDWRQDQRRNERASIASLNLSRRLLGFDHTRIEALLAGESTAVAAACLRLAPHHLIISYLRTLAPSTASEMIDLLVSHRSPRPSLVSALNRLFSQEKRAGSRAAARGRLIRALMAVSA